LRLEAEANKKNAAANAAIDKRNQVKLDKAQAEYEAAKAAYDAKTANIVTNVDFDATATPNDGTPLSAAKDGKKAALTIEFAKVGDKATQQTTKMIFTNGAGATPAVTGFTGSATLTIDGENLDFAKDDDLEDVVTKINEHAVLGKKYTAQRSNTNELMLINIVPGSADAPKVQFVGKDDYTLKVTDTSKFIVTGGQDKGEETFQVGESVTIAGKKFTFYNSADGAFNNGGDANNFGVDIKGRATKENQMTALADVVIAKLGTEYDITDQNGVALTTAMTPGTHATVAATADFEFTGAGEGTLTFANIYASTTPKVINVTESTRIEDVIAQINNDENSLYDASSDGGKLRLTAREIGLVEGAKRPTVTFANTDGTLAMDTAACIAADTADIGTKDSRSVTSFTITAKNPGEDPKLTELQYTSALDDKGAAIGTKGPLTSVVTAGVNPSDPLAAQNATVTYELSLGDKNDIANGTEISIAGKTFKIFDSADAVVKAGATMNESIILPNAKDDVTFILNDDAGIDEDEADDGHKLVIGEHEFTFFGANVSQMKFNLESAFKQTALADKYDLTVNFDDQVTPNKILSVTLAAKDEATDVSELEAKYGDDVDHLTGLVGGNKVVKTGEQKLAQAIQDKVSALTATVVKDVIVKENKITFEAETSEITGKEFMEQMGELGFNAKVEAAPVLDLDKLELEEHLKAKYDAVTAEDMNSGVTFQIGANGDADQRVNLQIEDMSAKALGIADVDLTTSAGANKAIDVIDAAIQNVSAQRAQLGAMQNRLEHTINNLDTNNENLSAAESRIRDVDMAAEMMAYTKNNVLVQAAQSMLAQANQQPQSVLSLLQ